MGASLGCCVHHIRWHLMDCANFDDCKVITVCEFLSPNLHVLLFFLFRVIPHNGMVFTLPYVWIFESFCLYKLLFISKFLHKKCHWWKLWYYEFIGFRNLKLAVVTIHECLYFLDIRHECVQFGGLANTDCIKVEHDMFKLIWSIMEVFFFFFKSFMCLPHYPFSV